jgi:hypothetical protein
MYTPAKYIRYTSTSGDAAEHSLCLRLWDAQYMDVWRHPDTLVGSQVTCEQW